MIIYIGADHRGFALKERIKNVLLAEGYQVTDVGAAVLTPDDDYPDYAREVAVNVARNVNESRGILLCGSGFGVDIAANKINGVRSALPMSPDHAYQARHDDDVNVLSIAADFVDEAAALKIVKTFLSTPFAKDERYERRLKKISKMEEI